MKEAIPGIPIQGEEHAADYLARVLALHGLGTIDGADRLQPPNESWSLPEWQRRILGCVPELVEERCRKLATLIYRANGGPDR